MSNKKVLIVTYYWPPSGGSGVQRWLKFTKFLPKFGWKPYVFTPENPDFDLKDETLFKDLNPEVNVIKSPIWEPYSLYKKLVPEKPGKSANTGLVGNNKNKGLLSKLSVWVRGNLFIPDPRVFWVKPSAKKIIQILKENNIDFLVTTGPPHSMHLIGLKVKKKMPQIKWLADFRDPWSSLDTINSFNLSAKAKNKHINLEKQVAKHCDKLIIVSDQMALDLATQNLDKVTVIENGFDYDDFKNLPSPNTARFNISHFGVLNSFRNPPLLWKALDELCAESEEFANAFELNLGGMVDAEIEKEIQQLPYLNKRTHHHGYVSHKEVVKLNAQAHLLLLTINKGLIGRGYLTGKLFEYFALDKPILVFDVPNGEAGNAIKKAGIGYVFLHEQTEQKDQLKKSLMEAFENRNKTNKNNKEFVNQFTRKSLTEKLISTMESI